jgi:hypothetical protein
MVPYWAICSWARNIEKEDFTFSTAWSVAHGWAHCTMRWWYTLDEVEQMYMESDLER